MIHTEICDMLNIKYPIIQAGMGPFATEQLAIAVSNVGALGLISHTGGPLMGFNKPVPKLMEESIENVSKATDGTFGVNVRVARAQSDAKKCLRMICKKVESDSDIAKKLRVVVTSAGDPMGISDMLHKAGLLHFHVAAATKHADRIQRAGCDAVVASGYEAGGHIALKPVHTFVLIPNIVKNVKIPVIAAGGCCDGKSLAAALALGASGVQLGTRFIATTESDFKDNYKRMFVKGAETDTTVMPGFFSPHCRYLANQWTEDLEKMMNEGASEDDLLKYKAHGRRDAAELGSEQGSLLCGMVVGQIDEVLSVRDVIEGTVKEAEEIIKNMQKTLR